MELVGGTPLYRLKGDSGGAEVWVKLEGANPGGSIKDRAAWGMLKDAQRRGLLTEKTVIVEPTSGNTGIGLAMLGRALGLPVILTMPESMSKERRAVLAAFGARLVLTPASAGMAGAVDEAKRILSEDKNALLLEKSRANGLTQAVSLPDAVDAPVEAGEPLGTLDIFDASGTAVASLPLLAGESVARLSWFALFRRLLAIAVCAA